MKRIAVLVGVVVAVAATPTVVTASESNKGAGKYDLSRNWNSRLGQLYGPVQVGPSSYGYLTR